MTDFLLAPFLTLFSLRFYRRLLSWPWGLGFLYLAYLSLIFSFVTLLLLWIQLLPPANEFVSWLSRNVPEMAVTRNGIQMAIKQPQLLAHPQWGPIAYLDPVNDFPRPEDIEKAFVVVTRTRIVYRNPDSREYRTWDMIPKEEPKERQDFVLTGDKIQKFWILLKPFVATFGFAAFFFSFYCWKLTAGLFYSLIALLINRFRVERLSYRRLLNLSLFALTPVTWLLLIKNLFPFGSLPMNFLIAFLVTTIYLALALLGTPERPASGDIITTS